MTSERKIKANRANARASTGPKTVRGRAMSARNALRHALSLPVHSDPVLSEQVEALASEIAGPEASAEIRELARRVAEAQIDLRRVRDARHQVLSHALSNPNYDSFKNMRQKTKLMRQFLRSQVPRSEVPDDVAEALVETLLSTPQGPQKLAAILEREAKRLLAMDRYEERALSRRKFAIRAFDKARQEPARGGNSQ